MVDRLLDLYLPFFEGEGGELILFEVGPDIVLAPNDADSGDAGSAAIEHDLSRQESAVDDRSGPAPVELLHGSADQLDVLLGHRLLREPGGFEGLLLLDEQTPFADLSLPEGEDEAEVHIDLDTALLPASTAPLGDEHLVTRSGINPKELDSILVPLLRPDRQGFHDAAVPTLLGTNAGRSGGWVMTMSSSQSRRTPSISPRLNAAKALRTISMFSSDIA
jgi:hypothetical protein